MPDPNFFDGPALFKQLQADDWRELEPILPVTGDSNDLSVQLLRGIGVADLVHALDGEPHRASARLAQHALEAMQTSSDTETVVRIHSSVDRSAPRERVR